jgi:hypothetical protein
LLIIEISLAYLVEIKVELGCRVVVVIDGGPELIVLGAFGF